MAKNDKQKRCKTCGAIKTTEWYSCQWCYEKIKGTNK